ncbi:hypothetical protein [Dongia sp.]|uniref:hypothetical protein n=1 Tax=Dongia sp. TaxID=1977262 RepID=UPI003752B4F9
MKAWLRSALIVLASCVAAAPPPALAHGDASWIEQNPKTRSCCGPHDCRMMAPGEVIEEGRGWTVVATGEHVEGITTRLRDSIDGNFWICRNEGPGGPGTGELRCLLVPRVGL